MARKVKRSSGRQAIVRKYQHHSWYDLPDWAVGATVSALPWAVFGWAAILAPAAALALVLGFHALPLEFLGIPGTSNGAGLAAAVLLAKFVFLALAFRPLLNKKNKGWNYLLIAIAINLVHSILLAHAITGTAFLLVALYLRAQTRKQYTS